MSEQDVYIQTVLLDLTRAQGETNKILESIAKDIKKNDERAQEQISVLKQEIDDIKKEFKNEPGTIRYELNALTDKAKYWKMAFCMVIGAGALVASVVSFSNDVIKLIKGI